MFSFQSAADAPAEAVKRLITATLQTEASHSSSNGTLTVEQGELVKTLTSAHCTPLSQFEEQKLRRAYEEAVKRAEQVAATAALSQTQPPSLPVTDPFSFQLKDSSGAPKEAGKTATAPSFSFNLDGGTTPAVTPIFTFGNFNSGPPASPFTFGSAASSGQTANSTVLAATKERYVRSICARIESTW
jgi:hypothetical protein